MLNRQLDAAAEAVRRHIKLSERADITVEPIEGFRRTCIWWSSNANSKFEELGGLVRRDVGSDGRKPDDWRVGR